MKRLNVLMIAYACDPAGGGEHWLGWGWAQEASRDHDVTLITTSRGKSALDEAATEHGMRVEYVDVPNWIRWLSRFPPGAGAWLRKCWWQRMARKLAAGLHREQPFDIVHQTTFHTFRIPFSCSMLGIPSVWGPIAGGESVPAGFEASLGPAGAAEGRRAFLNRLNRRMPWVSRSLDKSSRILVSNRTTLEFLPARHHDKCVVMSPNALREEDLAAPCGASSKDGIFEILFAGNCAPTRAMPLVFEALAKGLPVEWRLRVVGGGGALDFWKSEVARLDLSGKVEFTGPVPRDTLQEFYRETSVLVFPGLRDSGGSALLEAMTLALPILTFDWGGPGEMVDSTSAIMIEARSPAQAIDDIHTGLCRLANHPEEACQLGITARQRALDTFRWERKWKVVNEIYQNLAR